MKKKSWKNIFEELRSTVKQEPRHVGRNGKKNKLKSAWNMKIERAFIGMNIRNCCRKCFVYIMVGEFAYFFIVIMNLNSHRRFRKTKITKWTFGSIPTTRRTKRNKKKNQNGGSIFAIKFSLTTSNEPKKFQFKQFEQISTLILYTK